MIEVRIGLTIPFPLLIVLLIFHREARIERLPVFEIVGDGAVDLRKRQRREASLQLLRAVSFVAPGRDETMRRYPACADYSMPSRSCT